MWRACFHHLGQAIISRTFAVETPVSSEMRRVRVPGFHADRYDFHWPQFIWLLSRKVAPCFLVVLSL
jgi:hypothetical protein